jgi:outer membrane biosynthesis protein TonB
LPRAAPRQARGSVPAGRARRAPFVLLVTGLVGGGLALLLGLNTLSAANELRRHRIADQDAAVAAQLPGLRNEVAASAAPAEVARAAEALGMVPADNPAFLVVGPDGKVRVMGKPGPASAPPLPVPAKARTPKKTVKASEKGTKKSAKPDKKKTDKAKTKTSKKAANSKKAKDAAKKKTDKAKKKRQPPADTGPTTVTLPGGPR